MGDSMGEEFRKYLVGLFLIHVASTRLKDSLSTCRPSWFPLASLSMGCLTILGFSPGLGHLTAAWSQINQVVILIHGDYSPTRSFSRLNIPRDSGKSIKVSYDLFLTVMQQSLLNWMSFRDSADSRREGCVFIGCAQGEAWLFEWGQGIIFGE